MTRVGADRIMASTAFTTCDMSSRKFWPPGSCTGIRMCLGLPSAKQLGFLTVQVLQAKARAGSESAREGYCETGQDTNMLCNYSLHKMCVSYYPCLRQARKSYLLPTVLSRQLFTGVSKRFCTSTSLSLHWTMPNFQSRSPKAFQRSGCCNNAAKYC